MKNSVRMALILLAFLATGCSRVKIVPQDEAHMGSGNFVQVSVTIKAGQPVKFIDNGDATHILVVGNNGQWISNTQAPSDLNNAVGLTVAPGQEKDIVFGSAGTYQVTCTIHQSMLLSVTVTP